MTTKYKYNKHNSFGRANIPRYCQEYDIFSSRCCNLLAPPGGYYPAKTCQGFMVSCRPTSLATNPWLWDSLVFLYLSITDPGLWTCNSTCYTIPIV